MRRCPPAAHPSAAAQPHPMEIHFEIEDLAGKLQMKTDSKDREIDTLRSEQQELVHETQVLRDSLRLHQDEVRREQQHANHYTS